MKYDDASWHYGGDFPQGMPDEYAGVHIGTFLRWCYEKGWASEFQLEESRDDVEKLVSGKIGGTEFLFQNCDGKFTDEDLNNEGNLFAVSYYSGEDDQILARYAADFERVSGITIYTAPESRVDYQALSKLWDNRLKDFRKTGTPFPTTTRRARSIFNREA